jgi:hypothetical protein
MRADPAAILIGLGYVVGADGDEAAIGNLELATQLHECLRLPPVLGVETSAAEDQDHGMRSLQVGKFPASCGAIGRFVVGKNSDKNNVSSHGKSSEVGNAIQLT